MANDLPLVFIWRLHHENGVVAAAEADLRDFDPGFTNCPVLHVFTSFFKITIQNGAYHSQCVSEIWQTSVRLPVLKLFQRIPARPH